MMAGSADAGRRPAKKPAPRTPARPGNSAKKPGPRGTNAKGGTKARGGTSAGRPATGAKKSVATPKKPVFRVLFLSLAALAGGGVAGLAFAPFGVWPLAFVGVAALSVVLSKSTRVLGAAGYGYLFGLGLTTTTLNWMSAIFVDAAVGLIGVVSLFYLATALLVRLALTAPWWPVLAAGAWTAMEFGYSRFPFGGFGWLRLGYTMVDAPLASGYPLLGMVGVGFLTALIGQFLAWLVLDLDARKAVATLAVAAGAFLLAGAGAFVQPAPATGEFQLGWVQGGAPGGGVYGLGPSRTIAKNEAEGTKRLAADVAAGKYRRPDVVIWPENGTDLDLYKDKETRELVSQSLAAVETPILVGTILQGPGKDERQTASVFLDVDSEVQQVYVKRGIVPFGEFIPARDVLLPLVPKLKFVGAQSVPGDQPGVLPVRLDGGREVNLGTLICYDLAFDQYVYDTSRYGADVLVVQSSNAMYQGTGQIEQQFAMTRVRAAELRREILVVTTSGISGHINAQGQVLSKVSEPGESHGVVAMPARPGSTPAVWLAPLLELAITALSAAVLLALAGVAVKNRRKG
jgi:apolipoprotein N-acyltransferase